MPSAIAFSRIAVLVCLALSLHLLQTHNNAVLARPVYQQYLIHGPLQNTTTTHAANLSKSNRTVVQQQYLIHGALQNTSTIIPTTTSSSTSADPSKSTGMANQQYLIHGALPSTSSATDSDKSNRTKSKHHSGSTKKTHTTSFVHSSTPTNAKAVASAKMASATTTTTTASVLTNSTSTVANVHPAAQSTQASKAANGSTALTGDLSNTTTPVNTTAFDGSFPVVTFKNNGSTSNISSIISSGSSNSSKQSNTTSASLPTSWNHVSLTPRTRFCGTVDNKNKTNDEMSRQLTHARMRKLQQNGGGKNGLMAVQKKVVNVVFHVTHDGDDGNVSNDTIAGQIKELNDAYADYGFSFNLTDTTRSDNKTWFRNVTSGNDLATEMKSALRVGDAGILNLYTVEFPDNLLGFATFPYDYEDAPLMDGVVFLYSTMPGGDARGYNQGKTAVHEVGHWLGLYHTFQGGCRSPGDSVDDTPPQGEPTSGCPAKKNTCSGDDLVDAIHNYMDYSSDPCLTEFTQGQAVRMQALTSHYRGI